MTPFFLPIYLPFNEEAEHLVSHVADASNLSLSGKSGAKNKIVIASFLQAAQASDDLRFVWLTGKDNKDSHLWSFIPNLGEHTITKVRTALEASGLIKSVTYAEEFGLSDYISFDTSNSRRASLKFPRRLWATFLSSFVICRIKVITASEAAA